MQNKTPQNLRTDDLYSIATMGTGLGFFAWGLSEVGRAHALSYVPFVLIFGGPAIIAAAGAGSHEGWIGLTGRLKNTLFFSRSRKQADAPMARTQALLT